MVDGTTFTATGHRITYTQAKDLLILEGDGRNDAEVLLQSQPGVEPTRQTFQKILYWRKTQQTTIVGTQSLEIGQPPRENRTR